MIANTNQVLPVAKNKKAPEPKEEDFTVTIKVRPELRQMARRVASLLGKRRPGMTLQTYVDRILTPAVEKDYRELILEEAREIQGK